MWSPLPRLIVIILPPAARCGEIDLYVKPWSAQRTLQTPAQLFAITRSELF